MPEFRCTGSGSGGGGENPDRRDSCETTESCGGARKRPSRSQADIEELRLHALLMMRIANAFSYAEDPAMYMNRRNLAIAMDYIVLGQYSRALPLLDSIIFDAVDLYERDPEESHLIWNIIYPAMMHIQRLSIDGFWSSNTALDEQVRLLLTEFYDANEVVNRGMHNILTQITVPNGWSAHLHRIVDLDAFMAYYNRILVSLRNKIFKAKKSKHLLKALEHLSNVMNYVIGRCFDEVFDASDFDRSLYPRINFLDAQSHIRNALDELQVGAVEDPENAEFMAFFLNTLIGLNIEYQRAYYSDINRRDLQNLEALQEVIAPLMERIRRFQGEPLPPVHGPQRTAASAAEVLEEELSSIEEEAQEAGEPLNSGPLETVRADGEDPLADLIEDMEEEPDPIVIGLGNSVYDAANDADTDDDCIDCDDGLGDIDGDDGLDDSSDDDSSVSSDASAEASDSEDDAPGYADDTSGNTDGLGQNNEMTGAENQLGGTDSDDDTFEDDGIVRDGE